MEFFYENNSMLVDCECSNKISFKFVIQRRLQANLILILIKDSRKLSRTVAAPMTGSKITNATSTTETATSGRLKMFQIVAYLHSSMWREEKWREWTWSDGRKTHKNWFFHLCCQTRKNNCGNVEIMRNINSDLIKLLSVRWWHFHRKTF